MSAGGPVGESRRASAATMYGASFVPIVDVVSCWMSAMSSIVTLPRVVASSIIVAIRSWRTPAA